MDNSKKISRKDFCKGLGLASAGIILFGKDFLTSEALAAPSFSDNLVNGVVVSMNRPDNTKNLWVNPADKDSLNLYNNERGRWERVLLETDPQAVTLVAANWQGSSAPYTYTVSMEGVTPNSILDVMLPEDVTKAQYDAAGRAQLSGGATGNGQFILKAFGSKPAINIPIEVVVRNR